MQSAFHDIAETLAKFLVADPNMHDQLVTLGINPGQWPEGKARDLAEDYLRFRSQNGHDYAAHMLAKVARDFVIHASVPTEPGALRGVYHQELKTFRARRLADKLAFAKPEEIDRLVNDFIADQSSEIAVFNLAENLKTLISLNTADHEGGRSEVSLPGWERLASLIGGFNPGRVGLLVANTGFGKTNLAAALARAASKVGKVLFVNMEMMWRDMGEKFILGEAGIDYREWKSCRYDVTKLERAVLPLTERKILFTDGRALSFAEIAGIARREKNRGGLFMMFVDYDQKIKLPTNRDLPEWKALQIVVEQLEELAKQLEIFILLMSQSNEDGDPSGSRRSKNPASVVLRFHEADGKPVVQAIKNRFGPTDGAVEVKYDAAKSQLFEVGIADVVSMKKTTKVERLK